jgi:uncharacterized protein (TIGR03545 family)
MINWKKFIPVLIVFSAIAVFDVLFLDKLVELGLEKGLSAAAGAKASIGKLDLRLKDFSLNIYNTQVANKNDVWKNLVDIGRIRTAFSGNQLKYRRFIIDDLTVENLQFGTKRKYSGEIKKIAKKTTEKKDSVSEPGKDLKIDTSQLQKAVSVGELPSIKETERIKKENELKYVEAEQKLNSLDVSSKLKAIDISALQSGTEVKSIDELNKKLNDISNIAEQVSQIQKDFEANKATAEANLKQIQDNLNLLVELKNKDLQTIYGKLNIGSYDMKALGLSLLGPKINGYINNATYWMSMAKKYMPPKQAKKTKTKSKKDRIKGLDIAFSKQYPKFMIRKIALSGTNSTGESNEASYSGQILNITTEQDILGAPMIMDIKGKFNKNPRSELSIKGIFDHRNESAKDSVNFVVSGYKLAGEKLWDERSIPLAINSGTGTFKGNLELNDDQISGVIKFIASDLKFSKTTSASGTETLVADAISRTDQLVMEINLSGEIDSPELIVKTNVDSLINQQINALVGDKINQAKAQVEAEYNKQAGAAQAELNAAAEKQNKALAELTARQQAALDTKKEELDKVKDEINQKIEDLKNEQVDKLKEEAGAALKGLLKQ